jgi:hypothetical protein
MTKPPQAVRPVTGSGVAVIGVMEKFDASVTEKVSLLPATFVSSAAKPIRLFALAIFAIPLQPLMRAFVQMKGLIRAACAESRRKANPLVPRL